MKRFVNAVKQEERLSVFHFHIHSPWLFSLAEASDLSLIFIDVIFLAVFSISLLFYSFRG